MPATRRDVLRATLLAGAAALVGGSAKRVTIGRSGRGAPTGPIRVDETAESLRITTGNRRWQVPGTGSALLTRAAQGGGRKIAGLSTNAATQWGLAALQLPALSGAWAPNRLSAFLRGCGGRGMLEAGRCAGRMCLGS